MSALDYGLARRPRARRRFSILLPVLRPQVILPYAIWSVLEQTEADFVNVPNFSLLPSRRLRTRPIADLNVA